MIINKYNSLSYNTMVYLENKTLAKIQDLEVGDRLLSFKFKDVSYPNMSAYDFYQKYVIDKVSIDLSEIELCYTTVSNVNKLSGYFYSENTPNQEHYTIENFLIERNNNFLISEKSENLNTTFLNNIDDMLENDRKTFKNKKTYAIKFNPYFHSNEIEEKKFFTTYELDTNKISKVEDAEAFRKISISVHGNYFYFTEDFIMISEYN